MSTIGPTSVQSAEAASSAPLIAIEQAAQASAATAADRTEHSATGASAAAPQPPEVSCASDLAPYESLEAASLSPSPALVEMNAQKPRGRPFAPGQSGNPLGRPKGSRNRVTEVVEALIHNNGEALGTKALEKALEGDRIMLQALLNRVVPVRRDHTVEFDLPKVETAADALAASSAVLAACSRGEISPREASEVMALIANHVRMIEVADLAARVAALEEKQQK